MKTSLPKGPSVKRISQVALLRMRLAAATSNLKNAKENLGRARRRRKLARLQAKRAKRETKEAKRNLAEIREAMAKATAAQARTVASKKVRQSDKAKALLHQSLKGRPSAGRRSLPGVSCPSGWPRRQRPFRL